MNKKEKISLSEHEQTNLHNIKDLLISNFIVIEERYEKFCSMNEAERIESFLLAKKNNRNILLEPLKDALNIAKNKSGFVAIFSPIVDKIKLVDYIYASFCSELQLITLERGNFMCRDWNKLADLIDELALFDNLHIITDPLLTSENILKYCNTISSWYKTESENCIMIDYFNLVTSNKSSKTEFNHKLFAEKLSKKYNAKVIPVYRNE